MSSIGIIGIGRLGLSFALLAEQCGYNILGCDTRVDHVIALLDKSYTTSEPLINEYLASATNFTPTASLQTVAENCDILFVFVATPSLPDSSYDHSAIDGIVNQLQELSVKGVDMGGKILVIGCTTMPGYCKSISDRLESMGISVAYNPEFIAQGDIINGLRTADMVLMGVSEDSTYHALQAIYRTIMTREPVISRMSLTAAEITKISINCYLTMKIAYANMIGEITINSGLEPEVPTILQAIGSDSRIGNKYLGYGYSASGVCLPRDQRALGVYMEDMGIKARLPMAIDNANIAHGHYLTAYLIKQNPDKSIPFLFTQLAYKKGVDILTESAPYYICKNLLAMGYRIDITESPAVIAQVREELDEYSDQITWGTVTNGYKITI